MTIARTTIPIMLYILSHFIFFLYSVTVKSPFLHRLKSRFFLSLYISNTMLPDGINKNIKRNANSITSFDEEISIANNNIIYVF